MNLGSKYKGNVFKCHDGQSYRCGFCEVEDVYARFLKDGEEVNAFVGLKSCSNAKLPGVTKAVNIAMTDVCQIAKKKAVAQGFEGASAMDGEIGRVLRPAEKRCSPSDQGTLDCSLIRACLFGYF